MRWEKVHEPDLSAHTHTFDDPQGNPALTEDDKEQR